jgi:hypothetical protein
VGLPLALLDFWLHLKLFDTQVVGIALLSVGALINALIIYRIAANRERLADRLERDA